jgi:hypothetical protein
MLAYTSHDGFEGTGELPVNSIVEHIENNDCLVSHLYVFVAQKLDKNFLDPEKLVFVLLDLRHEEGSLEFFD